MIKMQILLDRKKIEREGQYQVESLERAIDGVMVEHLHLAKEEDGFYCGSNQKNDFSKFGLAFSAFRGERWFLDNVDTWLYFNSAGSENPCDYVIEDFKAYCLANPVGEGLQ